MDNLMKYPSTSTVAYTKALASLASDANLLAGWEVASVDNRSTLDIDHLLGGQIMVGTTPTVNTVIQGWAFAPIRIASGTPTWPDVMDGTSSAETITNLGIRLAFREAFTINVTANTSNLAYVIPTTSIADLFGKMPEMYGIFIAQNTGVALNATEGNHILEYSRIQAQTV